MGLPAASVCRPAGCGIGCCLVSRPSVAAASLGISTGAMDNQKRLVTRNRCCAPDGRCGKQPRPMMQCKHLPLVLAADLSTAVCGGDKQGSVGRFQVHRQGIKRGCLQLSLVSHCRGAWG